MKDTDGENAFSIFNVHRGLMELIHCYSTLNYGKFMQLGIHPGQLPVLKLLFEQEGLSQKEMADYLHVKAPTITVTVKRLEKAGIVYRKSDVKDMRVSRIFLEEKGKNIARELHDLMRENEQILTKGFCEEELRQIMDYFRRMTDNLKCAAAGEQETLEEDKALGEQSL